MLQNFRTGKAPLLIDMANDENGKALFLSNTHQAHCTFLNLAYTSRCRVAVIIRNCLNGIDDHDFWIRTVNAFHDGRDICL